MITFQVYDDRTNEVLYQSKSEIRCVNYIDNKYEEDSEDYGHIWIKIVGNNNFKNKFFELFSLDDFETMQYALECRYGLTSELANKLSKFLKENKE